RYILANKAYATLCGTTPEKLIGQPAGAYFGAEQGRKVRAEDQRTMTAGIPSEPREVNLRSLSDGQSRNWRNQKVPIRDAAGPTSGILTLGTDITSLKEAEAALIAAQERLRDSEQRFRDFTESASTWVWEQDEHLRFTFISAGFAPLSNIAIADHYGRTRR